MAFLIVSRDFDWLMIMQMFYIFGKSISWWDDFHQSLGHWHSLCTNLLYGSLVAAEYSDSFYHTYNQESHTISTVQFGCVISVVQNPIDACWWCNEAIKFWNASLVLRNLVLVSINWLTHTYHEPIVKSDLPFTLS